MHTTGLLQASARRLVKFLLSVFAVTTALAVAPAHAQEVAAALPIVPVIEFGVREMF